MSTPGKLTTTSYAVLGLLGIRDWSAYELVQQMARGWSDIWPRAISGIYREPGKLVAHGYATSRVEHTGNRPRTIYAVTAAGREAFQAWLETPVADPKLEAEVVLRAAFAEQGSLDDLRAAVSQIREFAVARSQVYLAITEEYRTHGPRYPQRLHSVLLVAGFLGRYLSALLDWADWVDEELETWDGIATTEAVADLDGLVADATRWFEANVARTRSTTPATGEG